MLGVALDFENYPSTQTPINGTNLNNMQKLLVDLIYPVGIYVEISDTEFDPNTAWGGTWELDNDGTALVSKSNVSGSKFNTEIGTIVGEEEHNLAIDEMPIHNHNFIGYPYYGGNISWGNETETIPYFYPPNGEQTYSRDASIQNIGGSQPHNNIQPSKITNRWHRTA